MTKWKLVPVEPTDEMVWKAEEDSPEFHHGDPWYGSEPPSEGQINAIYSAMLEAAPNPPAFDHDAMDVFAANRFHVKPCDKRLFGWQVTAGDGEQTLYVGRKPDCENVARKLAGAFLDGAFYYSGLANAPQPPALSDERILHHLDAILKASGSGLKNYSMHKTIEEMKQALRAIEREILGGGE